MRFPRVSVSVVVGLLAALATNVAVAQSLGIKVD